MPIVTDREKAIIYAIKTELPSNKYFFCWNHILRDVEFWLKKYHVEKGNIEVYKSHVKELLDASSQEDFIGIKNQMTQHWSAEFLSYFNKDLNESIESGIIMEVTRIWTVQ